MNGTKNMLPKKIKTKKSAPQVTFKVPLMKNAFISEKNARKALSKFVLAAPRLSMDKQCAEFEKAFAKKQGRKYAILFNSGGSANLAMIQALKNLGRLKTGDNVGFSAVTWSTNVMPILQMGLGAIPVDCDPKTLNCMSDSALPQLEKENCKAFFITNVLGLSGDLDVMEKDCAKKGIIVLEDNCESLGTVLSKGKTGNFSLASSFSFFVAHHMSTIEGGMVCTDDHDFAEMLKIVRANGWDRNLHPDRQIVWRSKHAIESDFHAKYTFYDLGYNLRPTEITGFIGLHQLPLLDKTIKIREKTFKKVYAALEKNDDFLPLSYGHIKVISAFALPFVCKTPELRKKYIEIFTTAGVEIRPMIAGNMQKQPFHKKYTNKNFELPGADLLHHNAFYCGNCPDYTDSEIKIILNCIIKKK